METKNFKYNEHGTIDCEIDHPVYGWIPFTASPSDVEEFGRDVYQSIINSEVEVAAYVAPIVDEQAVLNQWRNSAEVSRFQAYAALYQAGYYETIQTYMATQADVIHKMAWETAQVFRRMSPTVLELQPLLDLTDEQLDDLFRFALTIQA